MTTLASLLNLGGPDLIIIMGIVLLLFGAKKLPELARGMGQAVREFSKAKDEFSNEINRPPAPPTTVQIEQPKSPVTEDPHQQQHDQHTTTHV